MAVALLSKSRFISGLQCPLRLWYQCYEPKLAAKISQGQQAIFDMGHKVGRLATKLFPKGILIEEDHMQHREAEITTGAALKNKRVPAIFEGAFSFDGIRIRVDVLERVGGCGWNLIEVKSSTSVKEVYKPDLTIQYHVLNGAGIDVNRAGILHINNQYVFDGQQINLKGLFNFVDVTDEIFELQDDLVRQADVLKKVLSQDSAPIASPSRHCYNPYKCEFWEYCTKNMPKFWIMNLSGISNGKFLRLSETGIEDIADIPDGFPLSAIQERIKDCVKNNSEFQSPALIEELLDVDYPIHFLDFETFGSAIPRYANTRPYQTIPFQWSDHQISSSGDLSHSEYLCSDDKDPRIEFIETLLSALGSKGSIFSYTTYEKGVLEKVAEEFPQYRNCITDIINRFKDLHDIIRRNYYNPAFNGSFSLKSVLPGLVPSMKYSNLAIQEGTIASLEYLRMIDSVTPSFEKCRIRKNLLEYCGQDTLGMVKIRDELIKRANALGY